MSRTPRSRPPATPLMPVLALYLAAILLVQALAAAWAPWRSVATWYLWRSLDPVPVEY